VTFCHGFIERFRRHKLNLKGFYWTLDGLADALGQELVVPAVPEVEQDL
jgi:hypothetical protein